MKTKNAAALLRARGGKPSKGKQKSTKRAAIAQRKTALKKSLAAQKKRRLKMHVPKPFFTRRVAEALDSVARELQNLRSQLARFESQIRELMKEIERKRRQENHTKEQVEKAQEQRGQLLKNLQKATDAYANLLQSSSSMFA